MNLLERAQNIVYKRTEESERQYGPFDEGMKKASEIASIITGKDLTPADMCIVLVALKMSRESYAHKEDNILDSLAYLEMYNQLKNTEK